MSASRESSNFVDVASELVPINDFMRVEANGSIANTEFVLAQDVGLLSPATIQRIIINEVHQSKYKNKRRLTVIHFLKEYFTTEKNHLKKFWRKKIKSRDELRVDGIGVSIRGYLRKYKGKENKFLGEEIPTIKEIALECLKKTRRIMGVGRKNTMKKRKTKSHGKTKSHNRKRKSYRKTKRPNKN